MTTATGTASSTSSTVETAALLQAITAAQGLYIQDMPPRLVFEHLLRQFLDLSNSEYGFIGEVLEDESGRPYLLTRAISNIAWSPETRAFFERYEAEGLSFTNLDTLFGRVITGKQRLISNEPTTDPRRGGLPAGHPDMSSFLGEPLLLGDRMVGMVGLANRPGGFENAFVDSLQPLFAACAQLVQSTRIDQQRKAALDAAVSTSERMNSLLATATDAVFVLDAEGRILASNPAANRLFDAMPGALDGESFSTLLANPEQRLSLDGIYESSRAGETQPTLRYAFKTTAGRTFPATLSIGRAAPHGKVVYSAIVRDESERDAREHQLEQSRRMARAISDAALDCVIVIDEHGRVLEFNQAASDTFQYTAEEALGRELADLIIPAPSREAHHRGMAHFLATGHGPILGRRIQVTAMRKDGELIPTELAVVATHVDGRPMFTAYLRDISKQLAEQALKERAAAEFNAVIELSASGFAVFSDDGACTLVNGALVKMTGLPKEALIGKPIDALDELLRGHCGVTPQNHPLRDLQDGDAMTLEWSRPARRVARVTCRAFSLTGRATVGRVLYFQDITHQSEVDRMRREFLATAAHELRTPLAAIHGYAELLSMRDFDAATRLQAIKTIYRQSTNMIQMINELLDLSRIEARQGKDLDIRRHLLTDVISDAVESFGPVDGRTAPEVEFTDAPQWVAADRVKMRQALTNLLSNAYKYSPMGGAVRVVVGSDCSGPDPLVRIDVIDKGIGIPAHLTERVFAPFYRVDSSAMIPGTGLGLALVKEIIELHEGTVSITSWPNQGTTVRVLLPSLSDDGLESMP